MGAAAALFFTIFLEGSSDQVGGFCLLIYAVVTKMPLPQRRDIPGFLALGGIGIALYNVALGYGEVELPR